MDWKILLIAIIIAWTLRIILTAYQVRNYRRRMSALVKNKKAGYFGTGISSGLIRAGSIVLLATNDDGYVTNAERMKGRTVFARFQRFQDVIGMHVSDLANDAAIPEFGPRTRKALGDAANLILGKMEEQD